MGKAISTCAIDIDMQTVTIHVLHSPHYVHVSNM